jgi:phosphoserine aminotransferase
MLCVEDALDGLRWAASVGGLPGLIARCTENFGVLRHWVARTPWIEFLAADAASRSPSSVCLRFTDPALDGGAQTKLAAGIVKRLEAEGAAYDIGAYRSAPPGLRLWAGPTVEAGDLAAALPWLDWAYAEEKRELGLP